MTDNQRELLRSSKKVFDISNIIINPLTSMAMILVTLYMVRQIVTSLFGSDSIGEGASYTLLFIIFLNVISSWTYNKVSNDITKEYVDSQINRLKTLKDDENKDNSDRGYSRDDSGSKQPDSQDSSSAE